MVPLKKSTSGSVVVPDGGATVASDSIQHVVLNLKEIVQPVAVGVPVGRVGAVGDLVAVDVNQPPSVDVLAQPCVG